MPRIGRSIPMKPLILAVKVAAAAPAGFPYSQAIVIG